jgi:hypothetical protein
MQRMRPVAEIAVECASLALVQVLAVSRRRALRASLHPRVKRLWRSRQIARLSGRKGYLLIQKICSSDTTWSCVMAVPQASVKTSQLAAR